MMAELKPYPEMKDSGVEWLGEVPVHWEVAALRMMYNQCLGKMLDAKRITGTELLPYLRNTDVQWDRINVAHLPLMDIYPSEYHRYTVMPGDLLVCEGGEIGRAAIWDGQLNLCGYQKALHRLRPRVASKQYPRFMYFALRAACHCHAFFDGHVSTIAHLTGDKLRAHRFAFPPFSEQTAIVEHIGQAALKIDSAIKNTNRKIQILNEYRTRLIADVVTGKLDVREAAANLPDEPEDLAETEDLLENGDDLPFETDDIPEETAA